MIIQFTLTNIESGAVEFVLHYNPEWAVPFITCSGESGHIFNWDMVNGSLLMDGQNMNHWTIVIEKVQDANA